MMGRRHSSRRIRHAQRAWCMLLMLTSSTSGFTPSPSRSSNNRISYQLPTELTTTHLVRDDDNSVSTKKKWFRSVSHLLRRRRSEEEQASKNNGGARSSTSRSMTSDAQTERADELVLPMPPSDTANTDFVIQNLERMSPSDILPPVSPPKVKSNDVTSSNVDITKKLEELMSKSPKEEASATTTAPTKKPKKKKAYLRSKYQGGPLHHRISRAWFTKSLTGIIERRSTVPPMDLEVKVAPRGGMRRWGRGQFRFDASIDFRRVVFRNIRLTGGTLEAKRLTLNVLSFLQQGLFPRYPDQFDIHLHNCTFTQDDLFESSCIRNGLARLLVRILSNAGVETSNIQVTSLDIVPSGKISCSGQATTAFGSKVLFEVRSGIGMSSRGHIVTFPGLEVSLGPALGVFVPVVPSIDLDIGHNARLRDVFVDGRRRRVTVSASTTVTPEHTMKLNKKYRQSKDAYSAKFNFDVGRWVTNLGNFTN